MTRERNETVKFICRSVYLATSLFSLPSQLKNVDENCCEIFPLPFWLNACYLSITSLFRTKTKFVFFFFKSSINLKTLASKKECYLPVVLTL